MSSSHDDTNMSYEFLSKYHLDDEDREYIESLDVEDEEMVKEIYFDLLLKRMVKSSFSPSPGELGLQRLKQSIKGEKKNTKQRTTLELWRSMAVAASLLLVVQTLYFNVGHVDRELYEPLADNRQNDLPHIWVVRFSESASLTDMQNTLLDVNATIIDGPSAMGMYRILYRGGDNDEVLEDELNRSVIVEYLKSVDD